MASILLSSVGSVVGNQLAPGIGGRIGRGLGTFAGRLIDRNSNTRNRFREGPRLADLSVQTSTYGKMIPIIYGRARLAGNMIWSRPIRELATTTTSSSSGGGGGKGGGGRVSQTTTTYSYYATVAIAVCEGELSSIERIWADAKQLDAGLYTIRTYLGTETQTPDSAIIADVGASRAPAHRGLAYVVIEDFPLADYGNRIPNFTFEVTKKLTSPDYNGEVTEEKLTAITLIPGAGEFVYDTEVQTKVLGYDGPSGFIAQGAEQRINQQHPFGTSNVALALNQLEATCPNIQWVSVVVAWFGDSLDAGACVVKPAVEYQSGGITTPDTWNVAGYSRATARQISTGAGGGIQYGGTPDDDSLLRLVADLRARGYSIMFYPMMFMDVAGKPWRGNVTGTPTQVSSFFTKTDGYNAFINHYANLMTGKVEAFVIGSELVGLTKVSSSAGVYPAVTQLVNLAASVKSTMGAGTKITYAADWSEYHHTDGGWYHLDPLWASPNIDVIGIDAYFPIKDSADNTYDIDTLKQGWVSGEGYDYYYTDVSRTTQAPLAPAYAWKNLSWWWNNTHTNPVGGTTAWVPQSKKIWFTEFGFASVDNCANQPNIFLDSTTASSGLPYFSRGRVDFKAQRAGITASLHQWATSTMVERMFLWTWDARPYPYFPDLLSVWTDGTAWQRGHWVQGKFGVSALQAVVRDLLLRSGLAPAQIDTSSLSEQLEGFIIGDQTTIRQALEQLQAGYFFDVIESNDVLKTIPRGGIASSVLTSDNLAVAEGNQAEISITREREEELALPNRLNLVYLSRLNNYQPATQYAERQTRASVDLETMNLPLVLADQVAKTIADSTLYSRWIARDKVLFQVPLRHATLEPSDVISVAADGQNYRLRILRTQLKSSGLMSVEAVAEEQGMYDFYTPPAITTGRTQESGAIASTTIEYLDIPALPNDDATQPRLRIAARGQSEPWAGAGLFRSDDGGANYTRVMDVSNQATMGIASTALPAFSGNVIDRVSTVTVVLRESDELQSITELALLNGGNVALLGNEIIQFQTATLVGNGVYTLSNLLRGRLGTEAHASTHSSNERFVMLNASIASIAVSPALLYSPRFYKAVTLGATLAEATAQSVTLNAQGLKPLSPVHAAGSRDGAGNLSMSWVRRTRLGGDWLDFTDVPLNEQSEAYEIDIMNASTVVRTLSTAIPQATYSAAQQVADFGSIQASVSVRIYQLSAIVNRGHALLATL